MCFFRTHRIGALAVGLLLAAVSVAVAGGQQEGAAAEGEIVEITLMSQYSEPTWAMEKIGEELGIRIVPNGIYVNDGEKVDVMLASGEFPDCGPLWESAQVVYEQGVTRGIPKDMIRRFAPEYTKRVEEDYPMAFLANQNPDDPDELLAMNGIAAHLDTAFFLPMFRKDWALNVGVELPNYESTKLSIDRFNRVYFYDQDFSLQDWEDMLVAFRDGDPDGNGQQDTIPLGANDNMTRNWQSLAGSHGFAWGRNSEHNGELYDYRIHPGMKDMIKLLNRWYEMNLIDKEFVSLPLRKGWEKMAAGRVAAAFEQSTYAGQQWAMDRPPNAFVPDQELGTGAEVVILPPLVGPGGQYTLSYRDVVPSGGYRWFVNAGVSDSKLEKVLQLFDYSATEEGWVTWHYGEPGTHFEWEGEPWESNPIVKEDEQALGMVSAYPPLTFPERIKMIQPERMNVFYQEVLFAPRGQNWKMAGARLDLKGETNLAEVGERYGTQLQTMFEEFFYQGILGDIEVDAEWDGYVSQFMRNGGEELMAELKKAPLVSGLKDGEFVY